MAVIWSHFDPVSRTHYEVRSAGSSLRLYTNNAFHTQYSPKHLFTGAVWDLLSIPALFGTKDLDSRSRKKLAAQTILMLGVGGGSAIHQLNALLSPNKIIGIEFNLTHIEIAQTFFNLNQKNVELIHADAFTWIKSSRKKFSVIVDDLFIDGADDPIRPAFNKQQWLAKLTKRLSCNGILIQNHLSTQAAMESTQLANQYFASAVLFKVPNYANVILALYKEEIVARSLRPTILKYIENIDKRALQKLQFSLQQIF